MDSGVTVTSAPSETRKRRNRPLWSLMNQNTCIKLANACTAHAKLLRAWIKWMKRFSLLCSLATAVAVAGTATTTLLIESSQFEEFRNGVSSLLYVSSGIVSLPKMLKIAERISKSAELIGQFDALASRLYHEMNIVVTSDREDATVFLDNSCRTYKKAVESMSVPSIFVSMQTTTLDEDDESLITPSTETVVVRHRLSNESNTNDFEDISVVVNEDLKR